MAADSIATVAATATLQEVAEELVKDEVGLLVVGSRRDVSGVISERDIVRAMAAGKDPRTTSVAEVASSRLVWCDSTATIHEAAELMMEEYVRHVLLEKDGHLVGIVSARDLLGAYITDAE
ncbi:MAG: CBS domain-containing protein [Acidimicrobiia bacterium]